MGRISITVFVLIGAAIALGRASTLYAKCKKECEDNAGDVEEDEISRALLNLCLGRCTNEDYVRCKASCRTNFDSKPEERKACSRRCKSVGRDRCQEDCRYGGPACLDECVNLYGYG
ncbi:hypothetical protein CRM22_003866 [Opisthorchis felineus]|uniref:Uncharacterized protein n=1 Tax=Opisthorchis felineus TaxID=147828 RepID=A0A4S2LZ29_OPIFE|nr:hypothetical protein CRM22_003866 [Opisthorchis felineus]